MQAYVYHDTKLNKIILISECPILVLISCCCDFLSSLCDDIRCFGGTIDSTNPVSSKSCTGYVIIYSGCPIIWASQLQLEIALSTTEAEYIALSTALRQTISLIRLVSKLKVKLELLMDTVPKVYCQACEDNTGAVQMCKVHKLRPHTKHINTRYHHFCQYINDKKIEVQHIGILYSI
jgi:hypothetical protein